jgi:hypothetical protein
MPKPVSELRTSIVPLEVHKITNLHGLKEQAEQKWGLRRIQSLFPSMGMLFKTETLRTPYSFAIRLKSPIQTISDNSVYVGGVDTPVHRKTTMILPSYRVMRGDFGTSGLPCEKDTAQEEHDRIHSPNTAAYVGALANILLSESGCIHFPEVYGTYTGIAASHIIDISDDYDDLSDRPWFIQNLGHFFELKLRSISQQKPIELEDNDVELEAEELEPIAFEPVGEIPALEQSEDTSDDGSTTGSVSTGYVFGVHTCSSDGSDREDGIGFEDDDDTPFAEVVFHDVPVQTTVMQKCQGTLYMLLKNDPSSTHRLAWLAQVVFALAFAQRNYAFVHNDLHVNNVMYVDTDKEYLYYNVLGRQYRVPTFGKIMKIIDFDRATYSVRLPGMRDAKFFMSDQFNPNEEAGGQYNTSPFYNAKFPEVKPNPSFDLVRLATSIFWDCYPKGPLHTEYAADPLFQVLMRWTTLPDGSSILFRNLAEQDIHERYRGFHLYKAISRYCKGTAIPRQQIEKLCGPYLWTEKIQLGETCLVIEG